MGSSGYARAARGARFLANPIGAIAAAVLVAGVTTLRLATGQPLEGLGATMNKWFLGDQDDAARAKMATRRQLESDEELSRIVGIRNEQGLKMSPQISQIADDLFAMNLRREKGATAIREAFPIDSTLDMLILRAAGAFRGAWKKAGGPEAVEDFKEKHKQLSEQFHPRRDSIR